MKEAQLLKEERYSKALIKEKRASAIKCPIRDSLTLQQGAFETIFDYVPGNSYKASCTRIAFILLDYTGSKTTCLPFVSPLSFRI